MEDIRKTAYERYRLDWMKQHGFGVPDLFKIAEDWKRNGDMECTLEEYIEELGFCGELWACHDEFLTAEYLIPEYMEEILCPGEYRMYKEDAARKKEDEAESIGMTANNLN